jgi:hypothetical protein
MGEENYPIGFIIGVETTDNGNQVAELIHKMNTAPHPIVVNMDGGTLRDVEQFGLGLG